MKIFLKIDPLSIKEPIYSDIVSTVGTLDASEHNVFVFEFCPIQFTHAQSLLSQHPETYGQDLAIYLSNVITHFDRTDNNKEVSLSFGGDDFKRKMSEDMGVGMAALFMHKAFSLSWKSILQIPRSKNLQSKRPDFQGSNGSGELFLFEAKGTTCPKNVASQIEKGMEQIKAYPKASRVKYVIASFFSGAVGTFPSTVFVLDPPASGNLIDDHDRATRLHYVHVLKFLGLGQQADAYRKLLAADFSAVDGSAYHAGPRDRKYYEAKRALGSAWEQPLSLQSIEVAGRRYATVEEKVKTSKGEFTVIKGLDETVFDRLKSGDFLEGRKGRETDQDILDGLETYSKGDVSVFDDGSFFSVLPLDA